MDAYSLAEFVEKRERFLQEVLRSLDCHSKAALALIYMRNDRLESPILLQQSELQSLERLESDLGGCVAALESLKGSLVLHSHASGDSIWRFKHPTIGDAYATNLAQSPELLGIFVQGSSPDKLIEQVTCGDVGIEKAVVIPKTLFPLVIEKLHQLSASNKYKDEFLHAWHVQSALQRFLTHRCSKEFLWLYLEKHSKLLDRVSKPGLQLNAVPEVGLAVRLHEFGLLPDHKRKLFVETVSDYAVQGLDVRALDHPGIQSLFEGHEFEELRKTVRRELFPRLDDVRRELQFNHSSGDSPDDHMQEFFDICEILKRQFGDDATAVEIIRQETSLADDWVSENMSEESGKTSRILGDVKTQDRPPGTRSIFDDIDS